MGGEVLREVGAALMTGGSQAGEDLPGPFAPGGFVPTGEFAGDYRWTQGPFRPIVGGLGGGIFQTGEQAGLLFAQAVLDRQVAWLAHGLVQQAIPPGLEVSDWRRQALGALVAHLWVQGRHRAEEKSPLLEIGRISGIGSISGLGNRLEVMGDARRTVAYRCKSSVW